MDYDQIPVAQCLDIMLDALKMVAQYGRIDDSESRMNEMFSTIAAGEAVAKRYAPARK